MENASKALIIAASTLIALMVLASMVYLFREGVRLNEHYDTNQIQRNLELYNSRFTEFDRRNNNIVDVISVCNLAYDVNTDTDYDAGWAVRVEVQAKGKTFVIPSNKSEIRSGYTRNKIMDGATVRSLYDLVSMPMGGTSGLGMSVGAGEELFKLGGRCKYVSKGLYNENDNGKTLDGYYYLFECVECVMNTSSGRVGKMVFRLPSANDGRNPDIDTVIARFD